MKKMGLWMAALTAVTVGGVYATWNYAESSNISKVEQEKVIALAPAHQDGELGSYAVIPSEDFGMWVESSGSVKSGDDKHDAVFVMSGKVTILFTPKDIASEMVKSNGLETEFLFSLSGGVDSWTYDADFNAETTTDNATKIVSAFKDYKTTIYPKNATGDVPMWKDENNDGTFEYVLNTNVTRIVEPNGTYDLTIPEGALYQDVITFNHVVLDTYAKYEAFVEVLKGKTVILTVNDTTGAVDPEKNEEV